MDARYKLIYDATRRRYLLYDLNEDPGEIRDISAEREDIVGSLAARLHAWRRAQLGFYSDVRLHGDWYPPVLPESL